MFKKKKLREILLKFWAPILRKMHICIHIFTWFFVNTYMKLFWNLLATCWHQSPKFSFWELKAPSQWGKKIMMQDIVVSPLVFHICIFFANIFSSIFSLNVLYHTLLSGREEFISLFGNENHSLVIIDNFSIG